jgi:hypothetical protein
MFSLLVPFASIHIDNNPIRHDKSYTYRISGKHKLNNFNPGLIIKKDNFKAGVYKNSHYRTSLIVGYDYCIGNSYGVSASLVTGYGIPVAPIPTFFIEYKRIRIDTSVYIDKYFDRDKDHRYFGVVFGFSLMLDF